MPEKARIAMLSFAHYHANFWAEALRKRGDVALAAIWDDDDARGGDAAARFEASFVPDIGAALAGVDAVAICSETSRHADLIERAASLGKSILCEKPLATTLVDALRIEQAVAAHNVLFMQSFPKRLDPVSHELKRMVGEGVLGRIHLVRIRHGHFYGLQEDFKQRWYVQRHFAGGGALLDEGVHGADLLCWLFGLPASVIATVSCDALGLEVEDSATALFAYPGGMTAELTASFLFSAADTSIEIYGTRGTVLVSGVDLASRDITSANYMRSYIESGGERRWTVHDIVPRFKIGEFHHQNAIAFARCLSEGALPPATVRDGRNAQLLVERAYEAARTGRRQMIEG
jgi:predicted dehydrogenase